MISMIMGAAPFRCSLCGKDAYALELRPPFLLFRCNLCGKAAYASEWRPSFRLFCCNLCGRAAYASELRPSFRLSHPEPKMIWARQLNARESNLIQFNPIQPNSMQLNATQCNSMQLNAILSGGAAYASESCPSCRLSCFFFSYSR